MVSITKLFGSYGSNCKLDSFNDEMRFFAKMSILDWCGVAVSYTHLTLPTIYSV